MSCADDTLKGPIYILGPMTGYPDFNFAAFFAAEEYLKSRGWSVINPARLDLVDDNREWFHCIMRDLWLLHQCKAVYRLKFWQRSPGANIENIVAKRLQLRIIDQRVRRQR